MFTKQVLTVVEDARLENDLWAVCNRAFQSGTEKCIQDQHCYTEESFRAALRDPDYTKYIITDEHGRGLAYMLLTTNLEKAAVTYMNPYRLAAEYPREARERRINYITNLAVDPSVQGRNLGAMLLEIMVDQDAHNPYIYGFDFAFDEKPHFVDFCDTNLKRAMRKGGYDHMLPSFVRLGGQVYYALKLS